MSPRADRGGRSAATAEREAPQRRRAPGPDLDEVHRRQREEFGGLSWGSAFFGWLVAVGLAALLIALLSAAGAAVGLTQTSPDTAAGSADTIGIVGGILLLAILAIAYYAGGYVAGRMARFNGPRQGLAVWLLGLLVTVVLAVAGVLLGAEYNVLESLNLPRIPIDEGSLTTGGLIALAAVVIGTLLAAVAGGKAGSHYHRRVDRVGLTPTNGRSTP
jgi:MFS family permease